VALSAVAQQNGEIERTAAELIEACGLSSDNRYSSLEAGLGCRPGIAASSEQRRLHTARLRDARGGLETLQEMA
jgi:hypothetical protein